MVISVKGIDTYSEILGTGVPILMIHGWGPDHRLMKGCMEPIFQQINGNWKRIYFDLPGMGMTRVPPWFRSTDHMLETILGLIDEVIPNQRFLLAGESYGGYLARGLMKERSSKIDGLLLICPLAFPETQGPNSPQLRVLEKDEAVLNSLSEADRQQFESIHVRQNSHVWQRFRDEVLSGLKIADNSFLSNYLNQNKLFSRNVDNIDKPYEQPTLILLGRQDCMVGYRDSWKLIENYSRASFVILDKAGHDLQNEQEELFQELVKEWIDRVSSELAERA